MANNPKYIRLADHMVRGLCVDMETGFSISGYDVREFPEDREQARFVRQKINAGVIEAASQAEYDAAHPESDEEDADEDVQRLGTALGIAMKGGGKQEHRLREKESGNTERIRGARLRAQMEEDGYEFDDDADDADLDLDTASDAAADIERREAIAAQQEEEGLDTDDPEEQKEATATRPAAKTAKAAKKAAKKGK